MIGLGFGHRGENGRSQKPVDLKEEDGDGAGEGEDGRRREKQHFFRKGYKVKKSSVCNSED